MFPMLLERLNFSPWRHLEPITGGCHLINRFGSVLGTDFEPIWGPSWPPKRTPKQSQIDIKFRYNFGTDPNGPRDPKEAR